MIGWVDGAFVDPSAPVFAGTDRGAILGDGLFETMKTRGQTRGQTSGHRAVFFREHLCRLREAAAALDLAVDEEAIRQGVEAVLARANGAAGALRITVTRGAGGRGLAPIPRKAQRPCVLLTWAPMGPVGDAPIALSLARVRRNPTAPSCRYKTLSYADAAFARAEAGRAGADDALMLSTTGRAACTTIGNLWARTPEGFVTPPLSEGVLPGIVRARLLAAGRAGEIPIRVGRLSADDLARWPLYRSNSLMGVQRAQVAGGAAPSSDNPLGLLYDALEEASLA